MFICSLNAHILEWNDFPTQSHTSPDRDAEKLPDIHIQWETATGIFKNTGKQLIAHLVCREALSGIGLTRFISYLVLHESSFTSIVYLLLKGLAKCYKSNESNVCDETNTHHFFKDLIRQFEVGAKSAFIE